MSLNAVDHEKLLGLLHDVRNGCISSDDSAWLKSLLLADEEARRMYVDALWLTGAMHWLLKGSPDEKESAVEAPQIAAASRTPVIPTLKSVASVLLRPALWSIAATAVCFTLYVVVITWDMRGEKAGGARLEARGLREEARGEGDTQLSDLKSQASSLKPASVATVTGADNAAWQKQPQASLPAASDANEAEAPNVAQGEELRLDSGIVELKLRQGVKLVVEGPALWTIDGANLATLRRGKLVARVPKQAIGFTLKTPTATIVDLGTEFGVNVTESRLTEVAVTSGAVEFSSPVSAASRLTAGHTVRFAADGNVVARSNEVGGHFDGLVAIARSGLKPRSDLWVCESFSEPRDGVPLNRWHGNGLQYEWIAPAEGGIGNYSAFTLRNVNIALGPCFPKGVSILPTPGMFEHRDNGPGLRRATRFLPKPVDLGVDAEYYLSFVAAKYGNNCYGTVGLVGNSRLPTIEAGWTYSGGERPDPFVIVGPDDLQATSTDTGLPSGGEVMFFVLRVVARAEGADSATLYVFRRQDTVPASIDQLANEGIGQPYATVALPDFESSHRLQYLLLNVDGPSCYIQFDEIRLGTSWQAVTGTTDDS